MEQAYAEFYRTLYEEHWWWRAREEILVALLERLAPPEGWGRILDVGCGDGLFFPILSRWGRVEGIEPDTRIVTRTESEHGSIHTVPFDETFGDESVYGLIVMLDVLEHLDDPVGALRAARRLLKPGGHLVITVPAFRSIWTRHDDMNEHRTRYRREDLAEQAEQSGLAVEQSEYFFHYLYGLKLVTRAVEAVTGGDPALPSIPPRPINAALRSYSVLERRVVGPLRLPFGSSLLAVLRPS